MRGRRPPRELAVTLRWLMPLFRLASTGQGGGASFMRSSCERRARSTRRTSANGDDPDHGFRPIPPFAMPLVHRVAAHRARALSRERRAVVDPLRAPHGAEDRGASGRGAGEHCDRTVGGQGGARRSRGDDERLGGARGSRRKGESEEGDAKKREAHATPRAMCVPGRASLESSCVRPALAASPVAFQNTWLRVVTRRGDARGFRLRVNAAGPRSPHPARGPSTRVASRGPRGAPRAR